MLSSERFNDTGVSNGSNVFNSDFSNRRETKLKSFPTEARSQMSLLGCLPDYLIPLWNRLLLENNPGVTPFNGGPLMDRPSPRLIEPYSSNDAREHVVSPLPPRVIFY